MLKEPKLVTIEFSDYLEKSVDKLSVPKNVYVEGYLASLLSKFVKQEEELLPDKPLIFRLQSLESLKDCIKLGDETLFVTGFFPEYFSKRKNKTYVISIGKDSYMRAAVRMHYEGEGSIYSVLSEKFEDYSTVLNDVKYSMLEVVDDKEFFEIYKTWRDYHNPRALAKLKKKM